MPRSKALLSWGLQANARLPSGCMQCPTVAMNPPRGLKVAAVKRGHLFLSSRVGLRAVASLSGSFSLQTPTPATNRMTAYFPQAVIVVGKNLPITTSEETRLLLPELLAPS